MESRRIVKVEDLATTVRLKKVMAKSDALRAKQKADADADARKSEAKAAALATKLELQRMHLSMSAREAACRHLAHFAGLYMFLCVIAFLYAVQTLEGELVAVTAGLVTLVTTTIGGLLRSIVSENGTAEKKKGG